MDLQTQMHMLTGWGNYLANNTHFDFRKGHIGDLIIDVSTFHDLKNGAVRWVVIRELGTALFKTRKDAVHHIKTLGQKKTTLIRVERDDRSARMLELSLQDV